MARFSTGLQNQAIGISTCKQFNCAGSIFAAGEITSPTIDLRTKKGGARSFQTGASLFVVETKLSRPVLELEPGSQLHLEGRARIVVEQVVPVHILDAEEVSIGRGGETAIAPDW